MASTASSSASLPIVFPPVEIEGHLFVDGRLMASYKEGQARFPAYLDDHAFLLDALLQLLQARINQQAKEISRGMVGTTQKVLVEKLSKKSAANNNKKLLIIAQNRLALATVLNVSAPITSPRTGSPITGPKKIGATSIVSYPVIWIR